MYEEFQDRYRQAAFGDHQCAPLAEALVSICIYIYIYI